MSSLPLVSVAIPCYNHDSYVQECIQSIIDQDYENIELIIIDDGSSDNSVEKIKEMIPACEQRFTRFAFRNRPNKGLSTTLNEAIAWCEGIYFSALASDDLLLPQKTTVLMSHIEGSDELAGVFCGCYIIDVNGNRTGFVQPAEGFISFKDIILRKKTVYAATQLLNLENVRSVGGYPDNLYIEDLYMWLALTEPGYKLKVVNGLLVEYRKHRENSSNNLPKMYEARKELLGYFANNPLYNQSMAINCLASAYFFTASSKTKSIKLLIKSVGYYWKIIFYTWFIGCCIRIAIPRFCILKAKSFRDFIIKKLN